MKLYPVFFPCLFEREYDRANGDCVGTKAHSSFKLENRMTYTFI